MAKDKYTKEKCLQVVARDSRGGFGHIVHGTTDKKEKIAVEETFTDSEKLEFIAKFETLMKDLRYKTALDNNLSVRKLFNNNSLYHKAFSAEQVLIKLKKNKKSYLNITDRGVLNIRKVLKHFRIKY